MIRFFFCYNQISYVIASEAARQLAGKNFLIIYTGRVQPNPDLGVIALKNDPLLVAVILILAVLFKRIEVVLPHPKGGRLTRWFIKFSMRFAYNLSYIDDGMDTFRDKPKNIELDFVKVGSKYYTFDYDNPVAGWLDNFKIVRVCSIATLANEVKSALNLKNFDCLIIASPGVDLGADFSAFGKVFFITHPNIYKKQIVNIGHNTLSGLKCSVEKTILEFDGKIVVGESMVLIFALLCIPDTSRIHTFLDLDQYQNLSCIHPLLRNCGSLTVR